MSVTRPASSNLLSAPVSRADRRAVLLGRALGLGQAPALDQPRSANRAGYVLMATLAGLIGLLIVLK